MSLEINTATVTAVLLADGWHDVEPGSLTFDGLEWHQDGVWRWPDHGQFEGVSAVGAAWSGPDGERYACPVSSILAIRGGGPRTMPARR